MLLPLYSIVLSRALAKPFDCLLVFTHFTFLAANINHGIGKISCLGYTFHVPDETSPLRKRRTKLILAKSFEKLPLMPFNIGINRIRARNQQNRVFYVNPCHRRKYYLIDPCKDLDLRIVVWKISSKNRYWWKRYSLRKSEFKIIWR